MRFHMPLTRSTHVSTGWIGACWYAVVWSMLASLWLCVMLFKWTAVGIAWLVAQVRSAR
jgi:hypothetical protein